ncbi:transposase [Sulfitobacter sp. 1A05707]|uniref:transposase n=1 Tax=Sulfitobacter sp. 1A05707 TaxID=3368560 RepID=UPI003745ED8A
MYRVGNLWRNGRDLNFRALYRSYYTRPLHGGADVNHLALHQVDLSRKLSKSARRCPDGSFSGGAARQSAKTALALCDIPFIARIEAALPALATARELIDRFTDMVRNARENALAAWLDEAEESMLSSFARGLRSDQAAVAAALQKPWSNGQTEGQINRLKTLKRQMYGRANIDLLKARLV